MKTKQITAYTHPSPPPTETQAPDPRPGNYYVSVVDGGRLGLALGPFREHQQALAMVEPLRAHARASDPWSAFYGFGTVRMADDYTKPGSCNHHFDLCKQP